MKPKTLKGFNRPHKYQLCPIIAKYNIPAFIYYLFSQQTFFSSSKQTEKNCFMKFDTKNNIKFNPKNTKQQRQPNNVSKMWEHM